MSRTHAYVAGARIREGVTREAREDARARHGRRGWGSRLGSALTGGWVPSARPPVRGRDARRAAAGGDDEEEGRAYHVLDGCMVVQGPNYALAKQIARQAEDFFDELGGR